MHAANTGPTPVRYRYIMTYLQTQGRIVPSHLGTITLTWEPNTLTTVKQAGIDYILCKTHRGHECHVTFQCRCFILKRWLRHNPGESLGNTRERAKATACWAPPTGTARYRHSSIVICVRDLWGWSHDKKKYPGTFNTNHRSLIQIIKIMQGKSNDL